MKKPEKPVPVGWRMYERQKKIVRALRRKRGGSEAENVRIAIENEGARENIVVK